MKQILEAVNTAQVNTVEVAVQRETNTSSVKGSKTNDTPTPEQSRIEELQKNIMQVSVRPEGMSNSHIYTLTELEKRCFKIAALAANRNITPLAVRKKVKSIEDIGTVICSAIVVSAEACITQGLQVVYNDVDITAETPHLESYLVLIDGAHRKRAAEQLNKLYDVNKPGSKWYETRYEFPPVDHVDISKLLQEVNVATTPWRQSTFLSALILRRNEDGDLTKRLRWIQDRYNYGPEKAVWIWTTLNAKEKSPTKHTLCKAVNDDKLLNRLIDIKKFEAGKQIYEAVFNKLGSMYAGLTEVATFFADLINDGFTTNSGLTDLVDQYVDFVGSITSKTVAEVTNFKTMKGGEKRGEMILRVLSEQLTEYKARNAMHN